MEKRVKKVFIPRLKMMLAAFYAVVLFGTNVRLVVFREKQVDYFADNNRIRGFNPYERQNARRLYAGGGKHDKHLDRKGEKRRD